MKVYTKTGDAGSAQLPTGLRLSKGDIRFEALGMLDELNSLLGWCRSEPACPEPLQQELAWVQDRIMTLSAQFAVLTGGEPDKQPAVEVTQADTTRLEGAIDRVYQQMVMPKSFVVPGGCEAACRLHLARTCCRRAERYTVRCLEEVGLSVPAMRAFLNRLSDALFVWALHANHLAGVPNRPWMPRR